MPPRSSAAWCEGLLTTVRNPQNEGVGIAAPQVGIGLRVIAVQRFDLPGEPFGVYVNPEIVRRTGPAVPGPEGCLSVPDRYGDVARPQQIEIRYRDSRFIRRREVIRGYTAVIFQHEVDHLDGILFIDRHGRGASLTGCGGQSSSPISPRITTEAQPMPNSGGM